MNPETEIYNFQQNSFSRLNGFEFNEQSPVRDTLFVQPATTFTDQSLQIQFPAMHIPRDLKFPNNSNICMLGVTVGMYDLNHGSMTMSPVQSVELRNVPDGTTIPASRFDFNIEPGCLCIVVLSLQYLKATFAGNLMVNNKEFSPCGILRATIADGQADPEKTKRWGKIQFKANPS